MPRTYGTNPPRYTDLSDVPASLSGDANKVVAVNTTASGLEHRVLTAADIPNLDASKITTGVIDVNEIPNLSANKITSDLVGTARLATGAANSATFLRGDQTWQVIDTDDVKIQATPPTKTTNAPLGSLVYSESDLRLYSCVDATSNNNSWQYWQSSGNSRVIERSYPGGTLTNDQSASHASNSTIAEAGILYYVGTNGLTTSFTNPLDGVRIVGTASGLHGTSAPLTVLTDRSYSTATSGRYLSEGNPGGWFKLDFGSSTNVLLTKVALQQRGDSATQLFRTISVQYSSDNTVFTTATSHTASGSTGDWAVFDVTNFPAGRYVRILASQSSIPDNYFAACEILLYGTIYLL